MHKPPIRRALISVSDKLGLEDLARGLAAGGVEIFSTGGTRRHLQGLGLDVQDVTRYTGFPEMMGGRLKTLHPKIFGGILCRHDRPDWMSDIADHGIHPFELVVVNLYPFEATLARGGATDAEAIEQIDIGGPSLVRAAAKNHAFVTIATAPEQYSAILQQVAEYGGTELRLRRLLAGEAFARTASYDRAIAAYFARDHHTDEFPPTRTISLRLKSTLRYGENHHQKAAVYRTVGARGPSLVTARQLNGKELSYNNLLDLDSALNVVRGIPQPAVTVIKHNNPCGAACAHRLRDATIRALDGDPVSAFGSILGFNRTLDVESAEVLAQPGLFIEAIVAPDYEASAVGILTTRPKWRNNVRLMQVGRLDEQPMRWNRRYIEGGMLVQESDSQPDALHEWEVVSIAEPSDALREDLEFGWIVTRHVKSNAIVLVKDRAIVGVGAGQMSRIDAVDIAISKAGQRAEGAVLCSDAFFPFPDSIEKAAAAGVAAIIQPGGSRNDQEVIDACDEFRLPMIFTRRRHFKH